jgi:uncharacterized membrane protein YfhO
MPDLFGNPAAGDYWGYANFWEDAIYIGVLPLVLAFFAIIRGIKKTGFRSLIIMQISLMVCSLILALGKNTPVFPFLYENVPSFDLFQAPTRWMINFEFALVILAAVGIDLWQKREVLSLFWVRLGTVGGGAMVLFALIVGRLAPEIKNSFINSVAFAGLGVMMTGMLAWRRRIRPSTFWPVLIAAFVAIDLILAGSGLNPSISKDIYQEPGQLAKQVSQDERIYMSAELEEEVKFDWTHRFDTFTPEVGWELVRDTGLPNTTLLDNIPSANNFDPILPDRYVVWMDHLEDLKGDQILQALRMMNVGWQAVVEPAQDDQIRYNKIQNPFNVVIVGEAIWVESSEIALQRTLEHGFDFLDSVILEGDSDSCQPSDPEVTHLEVLERENPNLLQIEFDVSQDAWMVISESSYPGWHASIDGEPTQIFKANYLFKALRIPAGEHRVELKYRPVSFMFGSSLSVISWLLLGVLWWKLKRE